MKAIRYILLNALLVAVGLGMTSDAMAQRGPRHGDSTKVRPDSVRPGKPGHGGRVHEVIQFFAMNDSCREVLLAAMSAEDAAELTRLYASIKGGNDQLKTLRAQLRAAHEAGDSAAFRALSEQIKALYRQLGPNQKALAELFNKYQEVAMRTRKECGGRPVGRDGSRGEKPDDGSRDTRSVIAPNPVQVGGSAILTLTLQAESMVGVTISNETGTVLTIPAATLAAGQQQIALDVSTLERGMYIVQVQIGDKVQTLKLMVG
jgi:hypothetical protein